MKTVNLLVYCIFIGIVCHGRENEYCWDECDSTDYVAFINCPNGQPCTCEKRGEKGDCTGEIEVKEGRQTWQECQKLAQDNAEKPGLESTYFRWENKVEETHCYFLLSCKEVATGCLPFDEAPCVAGLTEKCDDPAPTSVCPKADWYNEDLTSLHWTCVSADLHDTISVYEEDVPEGTTCITGSFNNEVCATWVWSAGTEEENKDKSKIARVKCEGTKWVTTNDPFLKTKENGPEAPSVTILPNGADGVNDGVCTCDTLTLNEGTLSKTGLSLICDSIITESDDGDGIVTGHLVSGNRCALLCDGHFKMYIECYKGIWKNTAEYEFETVTPDDITC